MLVAAGRRKDRMEYSILDRFSPGSLSMLFTVRSLNTLHFSALFNMRCFVPS